MRRAFLAALVIVSPFLARAQPANTSPSVSHGAEQFINEFFSKWSSPNSVALPFIESAVDNQVNDYGQTVSREKFLKEELAFMKRWPNRQYTPKNGSEKVNCDQGTSTCEVTGSVSWNDSSPDRAAISTGSDSFDITLRFETANGKLLYYISGEAGPTYDGAVTEIANGWALAVNTKLSPSQVQDLGCLYYSSQVQNLIEVHKNCNAVASADLTTVYHTLAKWQFIVTQEGPAVNTGNLEFVFLKNGAPVEVGANSAKFAGEYSPTQQNCANSQANVSLAYPTKGTRVPLFVVNAACFFGGPNQPDFLGIWAYNPVSQQFEMIWGSITRCGEGARLFASGSLAGYLVSDTKPADQADHASPYQIIEVYRLMPDQHFHKVLYYHHFYNDLAGPYDMCPYFDPDALIDSELPTISSRLGLSQH